MKYTTLFISVVVMFVFFKTPLYSQQHSLYKYELSLLPSLTLNGDLSSNYGYKIESKLSKTNCGLQFSMNFPLLNKYYFQSGIRVLTIRSEISGLDPIQTILYSVTWKTNFAVFSVPVILGKDFTITKNNNETSFYFGLNLGVISTTGTSITHYDYPDSKTTAHSSIREKDSAKGFFISGDVGLKIQPFRKTPGLQTGALISYQINKSPEFEYSSRLDNRDMIFVYNSHYLHSQLKTINLAWSINYFIGKRS